MRFRIIISFVLLAVTVLASSCATSREQQKNLANLKHLRKGMTKSEVLTLMGEPLKNEVYNTDNVWYYFTESKWSDGMTTRDECTPLFFEEDRLLGWGQDAYKKYRQRNW